MNRERFAERARALLGSRLRASVPLAPFTTFRVGGAADWLADVRSPEELHDLLVVAHESGVPVCVLGGGSNVVVSDHGVEGLVVRLHLTAISQPDAQTLRAESGVTINGLVRWSIGRGLAGLEAWAGTPGSVGGAIYGNAHWGGRNIGDEVRRVRLVSKLGETLDVAAADMAFGYDTSRLKQTGEIVVWAEWNVSLGDPATLREQARASLAYRKRTQPLASPSAGCVFQNPDPNRDAVPAGVPASAGALVDRAGLKGHRIGGARISETHANFIVNDAGATAADIRALIELARARVLERFGVVLRDEVIYIGTF